MQLGNLKLENNVFLAPMAGITDLPMRALCRDMGAGLTYTEMVSAKGLLYDNKNTKALLLVAENEQPSAVQLFGSDPDILAEAASQLPHPIIDLNMGCPMPKIVKNGEGSALLQNPDLIGDIISCIRKKAPEKIVTVKIRKGFKENEENAVEIAKVVEAAGATALTVHGRTREQYYSGQADWDCIRRVKEAIKIPVIGNGDIVDPISAKNMLDQTGCDGIMIGRAARGNPWTFREIVHFLQHGALTPKPTRNEIIQIAIRHSKMMVDFKGPAIGAREMRKHIAWYTKGMPHSAEIRNAVNQADSLEDMLQLLQTFL